MSWWIACAARTLTEKIAAPPDEVRAFCVNLDNIRLVHPLVTSVSRKRVSFRGCDCTAW